MTADTVSSAASTTDAPRRGSTLRRFWALVRGETTVLLRNRTAVFTAVALPFLVGVAFFGMSQDGAGLGVVLTMVLVGTALMFVIYYTMVTSLVGRREQLVLKRLLAGEPSAPEILWAPAVPLWVLFGVQSLIAIGGALLLGTPIVHPWALLLALVGGAAAWTALAIVSAAYTRTVESAQLTTLPLILISLLLSGFSVPLEWLPGPVARIAHVLPMTPVVDLVRLAMTGVGTDGQLLAGADAVRAAAGGMLLPLLIWTVASVALGLRRFRWDPRS
ncbi:MAG: ABC transporter permease [Micropruina sp.]|uniref:ABC transporter permease n=1 Tax=Micropruina sp. TaxID=2737536 RepID=UPI0039E37B7B